MNIFELNLSLKGSRRGHCFRVTLPTTEVALQTNDYEAPQEIPSCVNYLRIKVEPLRISSTQEAVLMVVINTTTKTR